MAETDSEGMDNFEVRVVAKSRAALDDAVALAMRNHPRVVAWLVADGWLNFYWAQAPKAMTVSLPFAADATAVADFAARWLSENKPASVAPDIDGHCTSGFELETCRGAWSYASLRVRPIWAEHHK